MNLGYYIVIANIFAYWIFLVDDDEMKICLYIMALSGGIALSCFIDPLIAVIIFVNLILTLLVAIKKPHKFNVTAALLFFTMVGGAQIKYIQGGDKQKVMVMVTLGLIGLAKVLSSHINLEGIGGKKED